MFFVNFFLAMITNNQLSQHLQFQTSGLFFCHFVFVSQKTRSGRIRENEGFVTCIAKVSLFSSFRMFTVIKRDKKGGNYSFGNNFRSRIFIFLKNFFFLPIDMLFHSKFEFMFIITIGTMFLSIFIMISIEMFFQSCLSVSFESTY